LVGNQWNSSEDPALVPLYQAYLSKDYAYQQGLFRHVNKFPGVRREKGKPPTILGIRGVSQALLGKIFPSGHENGSHIYSASSQLSAESWGMVGPAAGFTGGAGCWGEIPVYAILTSVHAQRQERGRGWVRDQREMVVMAADDLTVEVRNKMPFKEYDQVSYERLSKQFGDRLPYHWESSKFGVNRNELHTFLKNYGEDLKKEKERRGKTWID
jgi:hypothetical protein